MTTAVVAGSTGLVGSNILTQLLTHPAFSKIHAFSRRDLPNATSTPTLAPIVSPNPSQWPTLFPQSPAPKIFFSGLGATRASAGDAAGQRKIDYDLNLALARAAKDAGVETAVIISAGGASASSMFEYGRMKGELEDAVAALGFKHAVFVRPGYIAGDRTGFRHVGVAEAVLAGVERGMRRVAPGATDVWAQDAGVIARAAVRAGMECLEGRREEGRWVLGGGEIVRLGREKVEG